jgi:hypothetical protein
VCRRRVRVDLQFACYFLAQDPAQFRAAAITIRNCCVLLGDAAKRAWWRPTVAPKRLAFYGLHSQPHFQ